MPSMDSLVLCLPALPDQSYSVAGAVCRLDQSYSVASLTIVFLCPDQSYSVAGEKGYIGVSIKAKTTHQPCNFYISNGIQETFPVFIFFAPKSPSKSRLSFNQLYLSRRKPGVFIRICGLTSKLHPFKTLPS